MSRLPKPVTFEWDSGNSDKNLLKHNVAIKESEEAFFDKKHKIFKDKKHSRQESRFVLLGKANNNRFLTIIFTIRQQKIRVISARDQSKKERKLYEEK